MAPNKQTRNPFFFSPNHFLLEWNLIFWARRWQVADVISSEQEKREEVKIFTERRDVQGSVAFLGGRIDGGATFQQLRHDVNVAFLGSQMQGIQSILFSGRWAGGRNQTREEKKKSNQYKFVGL